MVVCSPPFHRLVLPFEVRLCMRMARRVVAVPTISDGVELLSSQKCCEALDLEVGRPNTDPIFWSNKQQRLILKEIPARSEIG